MWRKQILRLSCVARTNVLKSPILRGPTKNILRSQMSQFKPVMKLATVSVQVDPITLPKESTTEPPKDSTNLEVLREPTGFLDSIRLLLRLLKLSIIFTPLLTTLPFCSLVGGMNLWWKMAKFSLEMAGPCWIKLGQWAAIRPDLFPPDFCKRLSDLHNHCPPHSMYQTKQIIEKEFGKQISEIFPYFEPAVHASGAIAQVHFAKYQPDPSKPPVDVVVKVRHPFSLSSVKLDLKLMEIFAKILNKFQFFQFMGLLDAAQQFKRDMTVQLDLRKEGEHLLKFRENFPDHGPSFERYKIRFPKPFMELATDAVLVETFEEGVPVSRFFTENPNALTSKIANCGLSAYLKMMLRDHFVHADLHPGNVLIRVPKGVSITEAAEKVELIFLDVGLVFKLSDSEADMFLELFRAVIKGDGKRGAELMVTRAPTPPCWKTPESEEQFKRELGKHFDSIRGLKLSEIHVGPVIEKILATTREHGVHLQGGFSTLLVATAVLEGLGRQLDPSINLIDKAEKEVPLEKVTREDIGTAAQRRLEDARSNNNNK